MRFCCAAFLFCLLATSAALGADPQNASGELQGRFERYLRGRTEALESRNAAVAAGMDGWLFLTSELRFLSRGPFWGDAAATAARTRQAQAADPLPAIVDFNRQLKERGIDLLLVPVPPKAAVYADKVVEQSAQRPDEAAPYLRQFYDKLRERGVDVLDLAPVFARNREDAHGPVYCRTDSHWSGVGCVLAAEAIAERVRMKIGAGVRNDYAAEWRVASIQGDLAGLPGERGNTAAEAIALRGITSKNGAAAVQPDASSPLLVLGDSHTLVFHDFLGERAGLIDQLAQELGFAPDLIGTRGSGATAVRVSLYRKARSDAGYLAKKKMVVWCFAAREFTEADQGWVVQPVSN